MKEFKVLDAYHDSLREARKITKDNLLVLLNENPNLRDHATDMPLDKLPIEALYHLLKTITLSADEVDKLIQQGPIAWICLRDIINVLSTDHPSSLATSANIHTLLTHVEHIQPIAHACRLLSSHSAQRARDTSSYLNQEILNFILLAGSDAPHVAACYRMLRQQPTDIPSPTLLLSNASSSTKTPSESKKTKNEDNIKAWLVLFIALPGLATAYEAIWDSDQLSPIDKLFFITCSLKLGTNIQAISSTMKTLSLKGLLSRSKIEQLFSIFTPATSTKTFIPLGLAVDVVLAKADAKKLPALKVKLADQKYVDPNFATKYLGKILTSIMTADAFDEQIWASLFQKISHLSAVIADAFCYLADQPVGQYKPGCRRVLTKTIVHKMLGLLDAPSTLPPQQLDSTIFQIVSTAMNNQSPLPNLSAKYYPHLHLQVMSSSMQNKRTISGFSSFFSRNSISSSSSSNVSSTPEPGLYSRPSSASLLRLKASQPRKPSTAAVKNQLSTAPSPLDTQLKNIKTLLEKSCENPTSEQQQALNHYTIELIPFAQPDYKPSKKEIERLAEIEKDIQRLVAEQEKAAAAGDYSPQQPG